MGIIVETTSESSCYYVYNHEHAHLKERKVSLTHNLLHILLPVFLDVSSEPANKIFDLNIFLGVPWELIAKG